jgi:hypothetical protein
VLQDLTSSQMALAQYMSELSENAYCAGWMDRLEFDLWMAIVSGLFRYGRLELTSAHIQRLSELSQGCGGWIAFEGEREETFVPMDEWLSRVACSSAPGYRPPENRDELERRYAAGERHFPNTELSDADLSGIGLNGANFEPHSWFSGAIFSHASLRGTSFRECNLKCADFSNADLTGAIFELAAIESIRAEGAVLDGVKVGGATFYGCELAEGAELPSWEW